ncbi:MAG: isocitrate/isopropylmalate family dehydrogenase, partial [Planctomycetota bacterium]
AAWLFIFVPVTWATAFSTRAADVGWPLCSKYTGHNVINPVAAINAMAMLLEHSGQPTSAARVEKAVAHVTGTKMKSQAAGKMGHGTKEVGDLVVAALG